MSFQQYGRKSYTFNFAATGTSAVDNTVNFPDWIFHSYVVQVPTFSGATNYNSGCSAVNVKIIDEDGYVLYTSANHASAATVVVTGMDGLMATGKSLTLRVQLASNKTIGEVPKSAQDDVILVLYIM